MIETNRLFPRLSIQKKRHIACPIRQRRLAGKHFLGYYVVSACSIQGQTNAKGGNP